MIYCDFEKRVLSWKTILFFFFFLIFPTSQAGKQSYTGKFVNIFLAFWIFGEMIWIKVLRSKNKQEKFSLPIRQKHIQQGKQKYLQETKLPEGQPQLSSVAKPWRQKLGEIQIEKQQRVWVALFCFKSELLKLKKYHHNERKPKELFGQNFTFHSCYINPQFRLTLTVMRLCTCRTSFTN